MAVFKCKMCGGDLNVSDVDSVFECEYCGTRQTIPTSRDEEVTNLFNRAEMLRKKCDFDKAEQTYERILEINPKESEAYWGVILCKFGVEYVEDPTTKKRIPTCHRTSYDAIISDVYYKEALDNADVVQRSIYEREAQLIDQIQKGILAVSMKESPYDVFISYKETDERGNRTKDSALANDIYYELKKEGFKVFYSAITLEDKLGEEYEPYIFSALNSARVMLVVGTKPEYFNAVWVKNEWSRFLKIIKKDRSKRLIPCYRDMDAYDLPDEFAHLQAQDMSKIGFISDVVRGIKKILGKYDSPNIQEKRSGAKLWDCSCGESRIAAKFCPECGSRRPEENNPIDTAQALQNNIKRAMLLLEEGDFIGAGVYADKCLDINVECAEAYLAKLMSDLEVKTKDELRFSNVSFSNNPDYKRAVRFADEKLSRELVEISKERDYNQARDLCLDASGEDDYRRAKALLVALGNYKNSQSLAEMCDKKIRHIGTLELKEETDKNLYACTLAPVAEAACLVAEQERKLDNLKRTADSSRKKQCIPALIGSIITIIMLVVLIASEGEAAAAFLFLVAIVATLVFFFIYAKRYMSKHIVLYIVLTVVTMAYFLIAIPFIMGSELIKIGKEKELLESEQRKLSGLKRSYLEASKEINDELTKERIMMLAQRGFHANEIADVIAEEQIDYI